MLKKGRKSDPCWWNPVTTLIEENAELPTNVLHPGTDKHTHVFRTDEPFLNESLSSIVIMQHVVK